MDSTTAVPSTETEALLAPQSDRTDTNSSESPDTYSASALAGRCASQLVDVLAGRRPLNHVKSWLSRSVASLLTNLTRSRHVTGYQLRSVHACPTTGATVEACAVIADTRQTRALTMRLERRHADWRCTMLKLL